MALMFNDDKGSGEGQEDPARSPAFERTPESLVDAISCGGVERVVVIGAGVAGTCLVQRLLTAARDAGRSLRVIVVDDCGWGASAHSGGWHMAFANPDRRVAQWAQRSFIEWPDMLAEAGLSDYRQSMPSMFVSNQAQVPVPNGHPGRATPIDPSDFGLSFWDKGMYVDDGSVISSCVFMPEWRKALEADPSVVMIRNHVGGLEDVATLAETVGADAICVAAGGRSRFLLDDDRFDGDFGVLLFGPWAALPEMYKHLVVMDEDRDNELTYSIPHQRCGHVLFGGKCGDIIDSEFEYDQLEAGNRKLSEAPAFARDALAEVYDRIRNRMSALAPALPVNPAAPGSYWFGVRPRASKVILEWKMLGNIPMLTIGGFGGSGFTIAPAVVMDALRMPMPREYRIRGGTRAEEE